MDPETEIFFENMSKDEYEAQIAAYMSLSKNKPIEHRPDEKPTLGYCESSGEEEQEGLDRLSVMTQEDPEESVSPPVL